MERALGGSLAPFAAYLAEAEEVSEEELAELERAVERLQSKRRRS